MAGETSGAYFTANAVVDKTAADVFIPEIWSDEVIAAYKKSLKMAPLVKRLPMAGKKGDVIHVPKPTRGAAFAKAESTAVTIQASLDTDLDIYVNRHFEYSRLIEDIVDVQALGSLRKFYTDDAGYALALQVDNDLFASCTGFGNGTKTFSPAATGANHVNTGTWFFDASGSVAGDLVAYAVDTVVDGDVFTDVGFRSAIKKMDDNNVPMDNRVLIIPPSVRKTILGESRYVSSDFRSEQPVSSGFIGSIYGVDIYVSSNCPVIETNANNTAVGNNYDVRGAVFMHSEALVLVEQMAVRSQTQYKQEYLADLFTADTIYGAEVYRPEAGFVLAVIDI